MSGPLKKYRVVRNGFETVMKLSDADAEKLGAGPYQVSDAVSTIEPVQPAEAVGDDNGAPPSAAAAMADAGVVVSEDMTAGLTAVVPVQLQQSEGDGPTEGEQFAQGTDPGDVQGDAVSAGDGEVNEQAEVAEQASTPAPAAAKTPARKRASSSANKARGGAANKATGSGGS